MLLLFNRCNNNNVFNNNVRSYRVEFRKFNDANRYQHLLPFAICTNRYC